MLRGCGKKILFVTNNSTKSRIGYLGKFESLGLKVFADGKYGIVVIAKFVYNIAIIFILKKYFRAALLRQHISSRILFLPARKFTLLGRKELEKSWI